MPCPPRPLPKRESARLAQHRSLALIRRSTLRFVLLSLPTELSSVQIRTTKLLVIRTQIILMNLNLCLSNKVSREAPTATKSRLTASTARWPTRAEATSQQPQAVTTPLTLNRKTYRIRMLLAGTTTRSVSNETTRCSP